MAISDKWYYVEDGKAIGPLPIEDIETLYTENKINQDTPMWGGFGDHWVPLKYTELNYLYEKEANPENFNSKTMRKLLISFAVFAWNSYVIINNLCVGDGYLWVILGTAFNIGIFVWFPGAFAQVAEYYKIPTYNINNMHKFMGIGILVLTFLIAGVGFGSGNSHESQACQLVDQILEENYNTDVRCKSVEFTSHPNETDWRGSATLDNNMSLDIFYQAKGDTIFVRILE